MNNGFNAPQSPNQGFGGMAGMPPNQGFGAVGGGAQLQQHQNPFGGQAPHPGTGGGNQSPAYGGAPQAGGGNPNPAWGGMMPPNMPGMSNLPMQQPNDPSGYSSMMMAAQNQQNQFRPPAPMMPPNTMQSFLQAGMPPGNGGYNQGFNPQGMPQPPAAPPPQAMTGGGAQFNQHQHPMGAAQQLRAQNPGQPLYGANGVHGKAWGSG